LSPGLVAYGARTEQDASTKDVAPVAKIPIKHLFVALGPANRVAVIDPETYEVTDYILVGQRPWHLELSPDHKKLYVANGLT
jgi:YVTN family beta-propeller protein